MIVTNFRRIRSLAAVFFLLIIALNAVDIEFEDDVDVESDIPEDQRVELWAKSKSTRNERQHSALSLARISSRMLNLRSWD